MIRVEFLGEPPTIENVDQRVKTLETLHYRWAPLIIIGLIGGYLWTRRDR